MSFANTFVAASISIVLGATAAVAEAVQIGWDSLVPAAQPYENPFAELEQDKIRDLRTVLRARSVASGASGLTPDMQQAAEAATARLEGAGLDIDGLFRQREIIMQRRLAEATAIRPDIIGKEIRMPGYILPLELRDGKAIEFLLVPTVGACIHTPPPPANQMVHVRYPDGAEIEGLFTPVWIRGTLMTEQTTQTVRYSDGQSQVDVSYAMSADLVEPY